MTWIQLMNRWRSNVWVCVELLLAFCLAWYMVDYFFVEIYNRSLPSGRDYANVWQVEMGLLPETSPDYRAAESDSIAMLENYERIKDRLRDYPGVQAMGAASGCYSTPYTGCYYGIGLANAADTSKREAVMRYEMDPTTDFLSVFNHSYAKDGRPVSTSDFDWGDPRAIVTTRMVERKVFGEASAVGREVKDPFDEEGPTYIVKGVLEDIKRFDNSLPQGAAFFAIRPSVEEIPEMNYFIRIDPAVAGPRFADTFREKMNRELRVGNFYLKRLTSYDRIKADTDYSFGVTYDYRVRMVLMAFLGLNILLCVMGTFWYRVRMRRGEIGLRMAIGSPREEIRSQMAREGICLLLMATPLALLIEAQFVMVGFLDIPKGTLPELYWPAILPLRFLLVNILTWILLAIVILLAVWLPASKAAEMEPAEALRYDG
mgnify:FL=1